MTPEDLAAEMAEFDAMLAAVEAERAALTAALEAGRRLFAHNARPGWHALVTPSTRPDCPPGAWQVTRIDAAGPQGHRYGTRWAGVVEALRDDGYTVPR
jgi:hypothetical protein